MAKRTFGEIAGQAPGSHYENRAELTEAGVHRPSQKGIAGREKEGAESIVVSGGYADDEDHGNAIIYTGQGGRDNSTGKQIADQELTLGNLALTVNQTRGLPVRVTRGFQGDPNHSPNDGYRYDGLFQVVDHWFQPGKGGFRVVRFRLEQLTTTNTTTETSSKPSRRTTTTLRIVRDTQIAKDVKALHDFTCQICGTRLEGPGGPYAEGAHIRGLGRPHNGPDDLGNILCLCPNHHVLLDLGAIWLTGNLTTEPGGQPLRLGKGHQIDASNCKYHRTHQAGQRT
jgi:putative restriction endonuclease